MSESVPQASTAAQCRTSLGLAQPQGGFGPKRGIMGTSARTSLVRLWNSDEGLVTLEWVALAAAVIILAIGVISVIQGKVNTAASTIGSKIVSTVNSNS